MKSRHFVDGGDRRSLGIGIRCGCSFDEMSVFDELEQNDGIVVAIRFQNSDIDGDGIDLHYINPVVRVSSDESGATFREYALEDVFF